MKESIKVESELGILPEPGQTYWYVRSSLITDNFVVQEATWIGGIIDALRLSKGNVYINEKEAREVETMLNERLDIIRYRIDGLKQKEQLEKDKARKKAEAEARKLIRAEEKKKELAANEKKNNLTTNEKAIAYEKNKKKRNEKKIVSPHPDVIV